MLTALGITMAGFGVALMWSAWSGEALTPIVLNIVSPGAGDAWAAEHLPAVVSGDAGTLGDALKANPQTAAPAAPADPYGVSGAVGPLRPQNTTGAPQVD